MAPLGSNADVLTETTIPPWLDVFSGTPNITLQLLFAGQPPISQHSNNGLLLTIAQTSAQPAVFLSGSSLEAASFYTLLTLDPDAFSPSTPMLKNVVHWIISNIPGSISSTQDAAQVGEIALRYLEPRPPTVFPPPYGIHRYYNLLFKQAHKHENSPNITTPLPSNFNTRDFIRTYGLEYPIGGTIYKVDVDS
ncbi:hypothetical protein L7F22_061434 [Adiantum nelumboides]|nr:hypothetical protein [Adiantum nelumboides]